MADATTSEELVPWEKPVRFDRLIALLPHLDAREGGAGGLFQVAHDDGCIFAGDWPAWMKPCEPYREPGGIEGANLDTCRKVLTIIVRQARFSEGSLNAAIKSGLASRIVRRIAELTENDRSKETKKK